MAVRAPDDAVGARHVRAHVGEHLAELFGNRVAGGVGQIDDAGAGADDLGANLGHVIPVRARRVLAGELDIVEMLLGPRDRPGRGAQHVLASHVELVLEMDVGGRDENVDAGVARLVDRAQRCVDVFLASAREADHGRPGDGLGDSMHRLEVAGRRSGEPALDDIDAQALELARDRDFLLDVHGAAGRLLAVAQRGVEDADIVGVGQDVPDVGYRLGHRRLSLLRALRDGRTAKPRGRQKENAPGGLLALRPGRLVQV